MMSFVVSDEFDAIQTALFLGYSRKFSFSLWFRSNYTSTSFVLFTALVLVRKLTLRIFILLEILETVAFCSDGGRCSGCISLIDASLGDHR